MDSYTFETDGKRITVWPGRAEAHAIREGSTFVERSGIWFSDAALCAEILRLAEERKRYVGASLAEHIDRLEAQVAEQAETIDRLRDDARMSRDVAETALSDNRLLKGQVAALGADNYALEQKAKRRKAKIRKLREEVRELRPWSESELDVARRAGVERGVREGRADEREAVLAYLEGLKGGALRGTREEGIAIAIAADIRRSAHLTAPASPPQEPSPSGESARG